MNTDTENNTYEFQSYDATAVPSTDEGYRLSKCMYKTDKAGKVASENGCVIVPEIVEDAISDDYWTGLMPHVLAMLEKTQDSLIKAVHLTGAEFIATNDISLDAILDKLEATGEGRLNKDKIFTWFDDAVKDMLILAFAEKLGISDEPTDEETARLDKTVGIYRDQFGALAGSNSVFVPESCDKLLKALTVSEADKTPLGIRFASRLEAMKVKVDPMDSL